MDGLIQIIARLFTGVFRISALAVGGMLLVFPAFKGMWLGYVPLAVGGLLLYALYRFHPVLFRLLGPMSERAFIALICLVPAVMQLALIMFFRSAPTFDGYFVYREAVTLAETGRMHPLTYYAPAQIWYFAFFFKIFGPSPLVAQICQIPLAALIPLVSYAIGCRVASRDRARLAAVLVALYPGLLLYVLVTPYYFYMYTLATLMIVWSWLRVAQGENVWRSAVYGGLAAGWGALTKATLLVAPLQTIFFWVVTAGTVKGTRRWLAWLLFIAVMAGVVAPWTLRNHRVFGETVLINTSGPLVFYSANNPESDGLYSPLPDQARVETPKEMLAHMAWCNEQAWDFIREHPASFARLVWLKLLHTWGTETTFVELINRDGAPLGWLDPALRFLVQIGWAALVFLWVYRAAGALWYRLPPSMLEIATGIFVLSKFLIYSVYEGGARHHMPIILLLTLYGMAAKIPDLSKRGKDLRLEGGP